MALGVLENNPECLVMILLVDERPEEVTDFKRSVPCEIWASSNDEQIENHIRIADLCASSAPAASSRSARTSCSSSIPSRVSPGRTTPCAIRAGPGRAASTSAPSKDPASSLPRRGEPRKPALLTIIASVLVETGSRMDDVIFEEFKGTGNMELVLDRKCAEMRLWPAINVAASGTRKEELLIDAKKLEGIHFFRRALVQQKIEEATETMIARLSKTKTNDEFLKLIAR